MIEIISDSFKFAFKMMPILTLVAKLIPVTIESTMFSFFTGLGILSWQFFSRMWGNIINLFFKIDKENINEIWKLYATAAVCSFIPITIIWLLPSTE